MTDGPVTALVANRPIDRLVLLQPKPSLATNDFSALGLPHVLIGPNQVPNLVLHDLGTLTTLVQAALPNGPHHVITVSQDTNLATLLTRPDVAYLIQVHSAAGTRLRIFWAACGAAANNASDPPLVFHNAKAVALAASAYARAHCILRIPPVPYRPLLPLTQLRPTRPSHCRDEYRPERIQRPLYPPFMPRSWGMPGHYILTIHFS
jgi:hypothetical protein